ncbi:hypothetical protein DFJ74DRAFT_600737 [Hyaloraphidium curvatum]|nr:hypothetical protein DFJ74DRAFT_600737 [Hyaloraphidium curvatum]
MLACATVFASCAGFASGNLIAGCVANFNASEDYFPDKVSAQPGDGWQIQYFSNYKLLTNMAGNESYVLFQCGTPVPSVPGVNKTFSVPLSTSSISDTTVVSYLEILGRLPGLKFVTAGTEDLIVSPCFQKEYATGTIASASATNRSLAAQELASVGIQTVFSQSSAPNAVIWSATLGDNAARRNYIKYLAPFFNQESAAIDLAASMAKNYDCIAMASRRAGADRRQTLAFTQYNAPSDFNNQTVSWTINLPTFKRQFTTDAGAVAPVAVASVDMLIDETFTGTSDFEGFLAAYGLQANSTLPFIRNKTVFRTDRIQNKQGWTAWFESAVLYNHVVLADISSVLNPALLANHSLVYLRNIATDGSVDIQTAAACPSAEETALYTAPVACPSAGTTTTMATTTVTAMTTSTPASAACPSNAQSVVLTAVLAAAIAAMAM